jgi:nitrogen fixation protein FixH
VKIWPAAIVVSLSVFVSIEIGLVRLAARGFEGPDDVNYYKMGLEYSRELERQKVQRDNGWRLEVLQRVPLRCRLLSRDGELLEGRLQVAFKRPATRSQDQRALGVFRGGVYEVGWQPSAGPWLVDFQFARDGQIFRARQRWSLK